MCVRLPEWSSLWWLLASMSRQPASCSNSSCDWCLYYIYCVNVSDVRLAQPDKWMELTTNSTWQLSSSSSSIIRLHHQCIAISFFIVQFLPSGLIVLHVTLCCCFSLAQFLFPPFCWKVGSLELLLLAWTYSRGDCESKIELDDESNACKKMESGATFPRCFSWSDEWIIRRNNQDGEAVVNTVDVISNASDFRDVLDWLCECDESEQSIVDIDVCMCTVVLGMSSWSQSYEHIDRQYRGDGLACTEHHVFIRLTPSTLTLTDQCIRLLFTPLSSIDADVLW